MGRFPRSKRMALPVIAVSIAEALNVQGDVPVGLLLSDRDVVAGRDIGSAVVRGQPVLIELDVNLAARRSDLEDVSDVIAEGFVVRIGSSAIHPLELR